MLTIINVTSAEQSEIRDAINGMLRRLDAQISDPDLRDCIRKKAQGNGQVINHSEQVEGHENDLGFHERRSIGPFVVWKSDDIYISMTNYANRNPFILQNTLMHEWAHSCCWEEDDDKGVPR